jgi:site-specific recombinase XerD
MKPTRHGFASILAENMQAYLHHKRALKRKFKTEESVLRLLDRYLVEHWVSQLTAITPALIEDFLGSRPRRRARSYNHLLGVTRCFFDWLVIQGRLECSPVRARAKPTTEQLQPFLFTPVQVKQLLDQASGLTDRPKAPHRAETYYLVFALMYALGLRVGEVSRLCCQDVDVQRQLLMIRETKFAKDRLVPFGPRVGQRIADYLAKRESRVVELQSEAPLFTFNAGQPVSPGTISQTFHRLVIQQPFLPAPGVAAPRLHSLRHSFAVGTLLRWYRAGIDPGQRLIHLSTFLGHVDPVSTAWYLTVTTELLDEANARFEAFAAPELPENAL